MLPDRCDYCDTYQRLGWGQCPACCPPAGFGRLAASPRILLLDLVDQLERSAQVRQSPDPVTVQGWLVLAKRALAAGDFAQGREGA